MITYALDFESFYDNDCSITTLGPRGYFSHPAFDAYMVTVVGDDGYRFAGHPKEFNWSLLEGKTVVMHNASFDESLYLYGVEKGWYPKVNFNCHCTADMTAFLGLPRSLKNATAAVFGTEITKTTRDNMKGKQWGSMTEDFKKEVTEYAIKDAELCLKLWQELSHRWPETERNISHVNRKVGQRGLPIDTELLQKNLSQIKTELFEAEQSIPWIGDYTPLSRKAFNEQCRKQGITPPSSLAQDSEEADAWFAAHQQACPWARAVQSYRRINAFLRKLEAFDAGTMPDGRYYGGLMYCGANPTARFSGSGGNLNLQNLPRDAMFGVNFRHMIKPKDGYKLIVVDLSQIEVRTLCWLAKDTKALDLIRESDDIYHAFGVLLGLHDPANGQLKDYDKALRHKVKSIVLGCFEPDTLVLTESGWKPILYLDTTDRVWDGVEWVEHKGILCQGEQTTIRKHGIGATADHAILTDSGWREWREVATNPSLTKSAVKLATLPSSIGSIKIEHGIRECNATAAGSVLWIDTTLNLEKPHDATPAQNENLLRPTEKIADMKSSSATMMPDKDSLTGSQRALTAATIKTTQHTGIMGGGVSKSSTLGGEIVGDSSHISSHLTVGTTQNSSLIELTTTKDTNQTISGLCQDQITCGTDEPYQECNRESQSLSRKSLVYDVSFAGPRNRFTILTNAGPMVVHNCGYGMGPNKFSAFSNMPMAEAEVAVKTYRDKMSTVVKYWRSLDQDMVMAYNLEEPFGLDLPSGRSMQYGKLKRMKETGGMNRFRYIGKLVRNGQMRDFALWGGILTENMSQGLARDIFSDMMIRVDAAGYPVILHVHDEMVCEVPEEQAEQALSDILSIMHTAPSWIPDIPVAAEGHILDLYSK
jgi:DNA polymerase I-like protein with 3'-5' exonuclease and polymerase domains